jgi:hypothetical protein
MAELGGRNTANHGRAGRGSGRLGVFFLTCVSFVGDGEDSLTPESSKIVY